MDNRGHLIDKFWQGNISESELKELLDLLDHSEELRDDLEAFYYGSFEGETSDGLKKNNLRYFIGKAALRWLSAAAILIVVSLSLHLFWKSEWRHDSQSEEQISLNNTANTVRHIKNLSGYLRGYNLPDHSTVELDPGSSIEFDQAAFLMNRSVKLVGTAAFTVHANKQYPFTVESGDVQTIATGTKFRVTTSKERIRVNLIEGKVSIKYPNSALAEVKLKAGEVFLWNIFTQQYKIEHTGNATGKLNAIQPKKTVRGDLRSYGEINFVNDSLSKVFDILSARYDIPITYKKDEIEGIYFTGKVLPTDQLQTVLALIANMNGLRLEKKDNQIFIRAASQIQMFSPR